MKKILLIILLWLVGGFIYSQTYTMSNTSVTTCSGTFYDSGGSSGTYNNNEDFTKTFTPSTAGNMLEFVFTSFSTESGCDYLYIYDGPTTASPLIGTYSGTSSPGIITATNTGQLTFRFTSDYSLVYAGWNAAISCVAPPTYYPISNTAITTCSGIFTDNGNIGSNYNGSDYTQTYTPGTSGQSLQFTFTTWAIGDADDYLRIYDGPNTSSTLIGTFNAATGSPGTITATNGSGQLTFVWVSDNNGFGAGWAANIACVAPPGAGENCTNAQDLSTMTSPYSGTTTGYADDISACWTGAADRIFFIEVPNCYSVDIWQSSNTFDSYHYMGYGSTCPGATQLYCTDTDLQHNTWTNTTGSTQTVWFVVDGYYSSSEGDFVLNWTLTAAATLSAPTTATHTPSGTQIIWDWNSVTGATGYKWNTVNNYATATDLGNVSTVTQTGLTCGSTYTIYVWAYNSCGNSVSTTLTSTLACATTNDLCADAITVSCGGSYIGNTNTATTTGAPATCGTSIGAPGVWYVFEGNGNVVTFDLCASSYDTKVSVYEGSCGSLTCVGGNDDGTNCSGTQSEFEFISESGTDYYIYVNGYLGSTGNYVMDVNCISCETPGTPSSLSVSDLSSSAATIYWSAGSPVGSATVTYYWEVFDSGDVLITSGNTTNTTASVSGLLGGTDYYFTVYAETDCNNSQSAEATSSTFTTLPCVTPGTPTSLSSSDLLTSSATISWSEGTPSGSSNVTFYWAVYTSLNVLETSGSTSGTSVVVNGLDCETSYYFTVYAKTSCDNTQSATATSSTFSTLDCSLLPPTSCNWILALTDDGGDGWDNSDVQIIVNGVTLGYAWMEAADGAGPIFFNIPIDLDDGDDISIVYSTSGTDYADENFYLFDSDGYLYDFANGDDWSPSIYVYTAYCSITPNQIDGSCGNSTAFCNEDGYLFPASVDVDGYGEVGCLGSTPNPAWYYMEIDESGDLVIEISSNDGYSGNDVDFIAWGPYNSLEEACGNIPMTPCDYCPNNTYDPSYYPVLDIVDCSYDAASIETVTINGTQSGEIYVLLITNFSNDVTDIEFSQTSGDATTNCGIVAPPINNNGPICMGGTLELSPTYPVSGATYSWTGPGSWTSSIENPTISNVTQAHAGDYSLIISASGYTSDEVTTTVVVVTPDITGLVAGDYVWSGLNTTNWLTASNWLEYAGAGNFDFASVVPTTADNVYIRDYGTCVTNIATIGASSTGNCKSLINESNFIMGTNSTLNVYGNWTNTGTFTAGTGTVLFRGGLIQDILTGGDPFYNLTINKTGNYAILNDDAIIQGNLTTNTNSILNVDNRYVTLGGNMSLAASTTYTGVGTGTLEFNGTANQNYSTGTNLTLNNVVINNSGAGITLSSNLISGTGGIMTFTNGIVNAGVLMVSVTNTGTTGVNQGNTNSYVNGTMRRYISTNGIYYMPIGNATRYTLAELSNTGLTGVSYVDAKFLGTFTNSGSFSALAVDAGTPYSSLASEGIWQIDPDNQPTGGTYDIKLTFDDGLGYDGGGTPLGNGFVNIIDYQFGVLKRTSSSSSAADWAGESIGTLPATDGRLRSDGYARRNGLVSFSQFGIGISDFVLPIELLSFNGTCYNDHILLKWKTASEINNDFFTVERSSDGNIWLDIATVTGAGNSDEVLEYSAKDMDIKEFSGPIYYRLRQTDYDGTNAVSKTIVMDCYSLDQSAVLFISTGLDSDKIIVSFNGAEGKTFTISVVDMLGRKLFANQLVVSEPGEQIKIDKSQFSSGLYNIVIQSETTLITKQIVIPN
ncbi:MAG: T9SS type A sorting domain-containing protein [Bacteroidales bacterium]|nr:T9SS type A sorting domain-containing protein [Bacteroidales bacterium]